MDKISSSLLEASDHWDLNAPGNVSGSGQSRGRLSLLGPEGTGIVLCDTDALLNALTGENKLDLCKNRHGCLFEKKPTRICCELFEMSG